MSSVNVMIINSIIGLMKKCCYIKSVTFQNHMSGVKVKVELDLWLIKRSW